MIGSAVTFSAASIGIFILMLVVIHLERKRAKRFFGGKVRDWFDQKVTTLELWIVSTWEHFVKYVLQLHWYYSIHSVLKAILHAIQLCYFSFEKVFERNRARAKKLRAERREISELNHLRQVADHKEETALSETQKQKLRHKKLEEKH